MITKLKKTIWTLRKNIIDIIKGSLENKGERVELIYSKHINFEKLNIYQKSHFKRYEFALTQIIQNGISGDFACGTGYGSAMISEYSKLVIGADIDKKVINKIKNRYKNFKNINYLHLNLLDLNYENYFDNIVSFETIEHLNECDIPILLKKYSQALKPNGKFVFSTPFLQEKSEIAVKMGFHLTFDIDEIKIEKWLDEAGFNVDSFFYQSYETHIVEKERENKDFIICVANKK